MTRKEAFEFLSLKDGAAPEEIQSRFRELAHNYHPDRNGDASVMARLYTARDVALGGSGRIALVPMDEVGAIVAKQVIAISAGQVEKRRTVERIKLREGSSLRRRKRMTAIMGLGAGTMAILSSELQSLIPERDQLQFTMLRLSFASMAAFLGFGYLLFSARVQLLEADMEELSASLEDKNFFLQVIKQILPDDRRRTFWSETELREFLRAYRPKGDGDRSDDPFSVVFFGVRGTGSPKRVLAKLPTDEASDLLLKAGKETGLLEGQEEVADGGFVRRYRVLLP